MITQEEISRGIATLRDLGVSRVLLFGTASTDPATANDLDLACNGLKPEQYFYAVGTLLAVVGKPVDLVDLDCHSRVSRHVEKHGKVVYER